MQQVNSGTAYILWCLWLFGFAGAQRFYTGDIGVGLVYLFTWGLFGFGQLIDLALIPGMVDRRNAYLHRLHGNGASNLTGQVTLDVGAIQKLQQLQAVPPSTTSPMQKLLKAAKENGGQLSPAQAAMYTELEPKQVKALLQEATSIGYAVIGNDPETGAIRYYFDV
jgi:TM2 domain-containing membrane protein YozV